MACLIFGAALLLYGAVNAYRLLGLAGQEEPDQLVGRWAVVGGEIVAGVALAVYGGLGLHARPKPRDDDPPEDPEREYQDDLPDGSD